MVLLSYVLWSKVLNFDGVHLLFTSRLFSQEHSHLCTTIYVNDTTIDQLQAYFLKKIREEVHLAMMSHRKKLIKNYF